MNIFYCVRTLSTIYCGIVGKMHKIVFSIKDAPKSHSRFTSSHRFFLARAGVGW